MSEDTADSPTSKPPEETHDIACVDCDYTDVIEGTQDDVFDAVEEHGEKGWPQSLRGVRTLLAALRQFS